MESVFKREEEVENNEIAKERAENNLVQDKLSKHVNQSLAVLRTIPCIW
jgi:hypothetical protein